MATDRPKFDAPPVVETAMGVQFERLPGYSTSHAGWFWKSHLPKVPELAGVWDKIAEAGRIEDQFERFGPDDAWSRLGIKLGPPGESQRTQIIREDKERMVQVQDSRVVLNWQRQSPTYPSYSVLLPEFRGALRGFEQFSIDAGLGPLEINQWELIYVNHIPKGEIWDSFADWPKIIPRLYLPSAESERPDKPVSETMNADWRFLLGGQRGRLFVSLRHAKVPPTGLEVMSLVLTARGPVNAEYSWSDGFELGHDAIVRTFAAITSPAAHARWTRRS